MKENKPKKTGAQEIDISGIRLQWKPGRGTCTFERLPVAMMWVDSTLAGLMSGVQAMVGTERFVLALQGQGRKSVEADWQVISRFRNFREGFNAIAGIAAVAGWGKWRLVSLDEENREARFRVADSWEGRYQCALGECWGSAMLAGKLAGYCSRIFGTNCWADQVSFIARGDRYDEFVVQPSQRSIEQEIEGLLATDEATRADMAVALRKLEREIAERTRVEEELRAAYQRLTAAQEGLRNQYESLAESELALRESEERFKTLFEKSAEPQILLDHEGNVFDANAAFVELFALKDKAEVLGRSPDDFAPEFQPDGTPSREKGNQLLQTVLREGAARCEWAHRKHDPSRTPLLTDLIITLLPVEGRPILHVAIRDITARKEAQSRLQESEEKFRGLVETTSDWIWETNAAGQYTYASPRVRDLLGYAPEEVLGREPCDFMPADEAVRVADEFARITEARLPFFNLENVNLHKDGRRVTLETSGVPRVDATGNFFGFRGVDRDITERKLAEAERLEIERRLLHAQKLESLGVLAGGVAHDFNNLLMAILGNLDLTLQNLSPASSARSGIEKAMQASRRATDLTRQMLAYSGKGRFVITRLDLNELVRENADLFRSAISRTVTMNVYLTPERATIEADPGQIQQIIMNLITNASEAIAEKPGTITLTTGVMECDDATLDQSRLVEKPPAGRFVFVEVSDTGSGMDEQTQQRLFDPFFTTKFTGRGLGMSAVLGIVRGHKGAIKVESAPGRGSIIRVYFPECREEEALSAPARMPLLEPVPAQPLHTILVVDDEESVRRLCLEFVRRLGFRGIAAADGEEALAVFEKNRDEITCVLLDLTMPRMDGVGTFKEIKRLSPDVPVILCSGYSEQDAIRRFTGEGLSGFIQKPYGIEDLRQKIAQVLCHPD
jgi:PAS domain S-box-containing protein